VTSTTAGSPGPTVAGTSVTNGSSNSGGTLAFTGSDLFRLILLALILLAVGTAIYRAQRRRHSAAGTGPEKF
jgi:hypothetical protein